MHQVKILIDLATKSDRVGIAVTRIGLFGVLVWIGSLKAFHHEGGRSFDKDGRLRQGLPSRGQLRLYVTAPVSEFRNAAFVNDFVRNSQ